MEPPSILTLSSCILLELARYLDSTSLYFLAKSHERLRDIITEHKSLWRHVDARRAPNEESKIDYCIKQIHDETRTLLLRGDYQFSVIVPSSLFNKLTVSNLIILALENQTIDGNIYSITFFPKLLQELSLKKSWVKNSSEFFRNSWADLNSLRVLILDECQWITSASFMSISKYPNLQILSVFRCRFLENSIAYLSLSGQWGFKQLRIFDARLTPLGNPLLRALHKSSVILAIYLQNEDISYKLDYFKRKFEIMKGAKTRDFYIEDNEFDVLNDSLHNEKNGQNYEDPGSLDDRGLLDYISVRGQSTDDPWPKSFLYLDPYSECQCTNGCESPMNQSKKQSTPKKQFKNSSPAWSSSSDDDDDDDDPSGDSPSNPLISIPKKIKQLESYIRRTQINTTYSRGLFDRNHRRSPSKVTPIIDVLNSNGDRYRSQHDSNNDVCVMNLKNINAEPEKENENHQNSQDDGAPKATIYNMIVDAYQGRVLPIEPQNDPENDEFRVTLRDFVTVRESPHYKHRDGVERGPDEAQERPIIDVQIFPPDGPGISMREAPKEIRKRILSTPEQGPSKRAKLDDSDNDSNSSEPIAGPSGLSSNNCPKVAPQPPSPHPDAAPPEVERVGNERTIYFRDSPLVEIVNLHEIVKNETVPLRRLSLRGYRMITDVSLEYINDLELEILDLTYTNVTENGIFYFLMNQPRCRIVHEKFCTCPPNLHF